VRYLDNLERRLWIVLEAHNQLCLHKLEKQLKTTTH